MTCSTSLNPYPRPQKQRRLTLIDSLIKSTIIPHLSTRNQCNTLHPYLGPLGPLVLGTQRFSFGILPADLPLSGRPAENFTPRHWLISASTFALDSVRVLSTLCVGRQSWCQVPSTDPRKLLLTRTIARTEWTSAIFVRTGAPRHYPSPACGRRCACHWSDWKGRSPFSHSCTFIKMTSKKTVSSP